MQELLLAVARGLVEDKEAVQVTVDPVTALPSITSKWLSPIWAASSASRDVSQRQSALLCVPLLSARAKKSSLRSTKTFKALCRLVKCFFILVRRIIPCKAIFPPARSYPPTACVAK